MAGSKSDLSHLKVVHKVTTSWCGVHICKWRYIKKYWVNVTSTNNNNYSMIVFHCNIQFSTFSVKYYKDGSAWSVFYFLLHSSFKYHTLKEMQNQKPTCWLLCYLEWRQYLLYNLLSFFYFFSFKDHRRWYIMYTCHVCSFILQPLLNTHQYVCF